MSAKHAADLVAANPELAPVLGATDAAFYAPFGPWDQQVEAVNRQQRRAIREGQTLAALRAMHDLPEGGRP